jgi:hypothetical protein
MPTEAQLAANRQNAQLSTGPKTAEGKEAICFNNLRHGLAGAFHILPWENDDDFSGLQLALRAEHNPQTPTEQILVDRMAQHEWLRQRALNLQNLCFNEAGMIDEEKQFGLYLRYQTAHERGFHKCLSDLLKLRAEKRKAEIGFELQRRKQADQARKDEAALSQRAEDSKKAELHEARTRLANAKAAHLELDTDIKGTIQAILPGHTPIEFNQIKGVLKIAIEEVFSNRTVRQAA